MYAVNMIRII